MLNFSLSSYALLRHEQFDSVVNGLGIHPVSNHLPEFIVKEISQQ